jgi:hypothetical protein
VDVVAVFVFGFSFKTTWLAVRFATVRVGIVRVVVRVVVVGVGVVGVGVVTVLGSAFTTACFGVEPR